jgi:hypothetical protein
MPKRLSEPRHPRFIAFLAQHERFTVTFSAALALTAFLAKDAARDSVKDWSDAIRSERRFYAVKREIDWSLDDSRDLRESLSKLTIDLESYMENPRFKPSDFASPYHFDPAEANDSALRYMNNSLESVEPLVDLLPSSVRVSQWVEMYAGTSTPYKAAYADLHGRVKTMKDKLDNPKKEDSHPAEHGDPYRFVNDIDTSAKELESQVLAFTHEVEEESANQTKRLDLWYSFFTWLTWTLTALTWLSLLLGRLYKVKGLAGEGS